MRANSVVATRVQGTLQNLPSLSFALIWLKVFAAYANLIVAERLRSQALGIILAPRRTIRKVRNIFFSCARFAPLREIIRLFGCGSAVLGFPQ